MEFWKQSSLGFGRKSVFDFEIVKQQAVNVKNQPVGFRPQIVNSFLIILKNFGVDVAEFAQGFETQLRLPAEIFKQLPHVVLREQTALFALVIVDDCER